MSLNLWELSGHPCERRGAFSGPGRFSGQCVIFDQMRIDIKVEMGGLDIMYFVIKLSEFEREELVHWDPHWPRIFPAKFSPLPVFGGSFGSSCDLLRSASCLWWKTPDFFTWDNHGESSNQGTRKRGTTALDVSAWTGQHVSMSHSFSMAVPCHRRGSCRGPHHSSFRMTITNWNKLCFRILHGKMTAKHKKNSHPEGSKAYQVFLMLADTYSLECYFRISNDRMIRSASWFDSREGFASSGFCFRSVRHQICLANHGMVIFHLIQRIILEFCVLISFFCSEFIKIIKMWASFTMWYFMI